jgi:hypothetical protein
MVILQLINFVYYSIQLIQIILCKIFNLHSTPYTVTSSDLSTSIGIYASSV